jgi:hypothetical protein
MKLRYISATKRRYTSIWKEFPNKKDKTQNEIEVDDSLGKLLLLERTGSCPLWEEIKQEA